MVIPKSNYKYEALMEQKISNWKKKLIDLSKRNNLISYRFTKSKSIKFNLENFKQVVNYVLSENDILIFKKDDALENKKNYWIASEDDETVSKKLYNLYIKSTDNFRELGVNTCFLSFGCLKYTDIEYSENYFEAPILLYPVQITKLKSLSKDAHKYEIVTEEGELLLNPALLEKMAVEYSINLDSLQNGQDILNYFEYLNKVIENFKNWEISYDIYLDIFSYQKYVMYEDIKNNVDVIKLNPLIQTYVGDRDALLGEMSEIFRDTFPDSNDIEILPCDSSQKRAIELAKAGVTFVLQGPPGTGKSQTICNMIAALIDSNKKVLFVSQKKAALDVVLKRLTGIGINRYCLNLHEYRGNKKEIVQQLIDELSTTPVISDKYKRYNFTKYLSDQSKINDFYYELCKKGNIRNLSIYTIRGLIAQLHDVDLLICNLSDVIIYDEEKYIKLLTKIESMYNILQEIPDPLNDPYYNYDKNFNTLLKRQELTKLLLNFFENLNQFDAYNINIKNITGFSFNNLETANTFNNLHLSYKKIENIPLFLISDNFYNFNNEIKKLHEILFKRENSKKKILEKMKNEFLEHDVTEDLDVFIKTGFFGRIFSKKYKSVKKELEILSLKKLSHNTYIEILKEKKLYDEYMLQQEKLNEEIIYLNKQETYSLNDLDEITILYNISDQLKKIYDGVRDIDKDAMYNLMTYINKFDPIDELLVVIYKNINDINKYFTENIFLNLNLKNIKHVLNLLYLNINKIEKILSFKKIYIDLEEQVQKLVSQYLNEKIKSPLIKVFEKTYYVQLLDLIIKNILLESPKNEIQRYKEQDMEIRNVKRYQIMDNMEHKQPINSLPSTGNERAILIREGEKKRKLKPIRQLLTEIPNLVFVLKPCFMMSPLTVSQYIDPNVMNFDVIIFDEASQIMPEDAVPCLMRSKQAIVLGDTQQLPPTTFFLKSQEDDYLDEEIEDLPSFLSEAHTKFRSESLNWHYRSVNENLIAFSNHQFYGNRLITFPNANQEDKSGIDFVYVENAVYDRGKSRKNVLEAQKVVDLYLKMRKEYPNKSFGIVAFGISQETAIREAFERKQIDLEESLNSTTEDLFIRNLETVQGDERDIIVLSVGYGKDSRGLMSYNFGPLNKAEGYKRLNVAITRSRFKTVVVCSFHPEELDEDKISESVRYLKKYLDFAKYKDFKKFITSVTGEAFDSEFEEVVYDALVDSGFNISSQVGCSGYRVDLAIKNPEKSGEYILGIECDGSQYHSSRYARDRDKVRQQVLEKLGWNIHRIWSNDWIRDREGEINKIKEKVNNILINKKNVNKINNVDTKFVPVTNVRIEERPFNEKFQKYKIYDYSKKIYVEITQYTRYGRKYITYDPKLDSLFLKILNIEGPMEKELLFLRASQVINKKKGSRINKVFNEVYKKLIKNGKIYEKGSTADSKPIPILSQVRISDEKDRKFIYIPKEELSAAIVEILKNNFSSDINSIKKDVSQGIYDIKKIGIQVDKKIDASLDYLLINDIIQNIDNKVALKIKQ